MSTNELTAKVRELKELQALIEEATAEAEAIKDMKAAGTQEMTVDVYKLRFTTVTSSRFDSSAFKATHAELYKQYCKPTTSTRFCVA